MFIVVSLQGFDEYMNLVLDDAEEVHIKKKSRKTLGMFTISLFFSLRSPKCAWFEVFHLCCSGRILLKGDNITLMMST